MTSMKLLQFSRPPLTCPATFKILPPPLPLDVQFQMTPPFPSRSPNSNQSIKIKPPRMIIISYQVFPSGRLFSINTLILSGFPFTSFHLAEANLVPRAVLKNQKTLFRLPLIA